MKFNVGDYYVQINKSHDSKSVIEIDLIIMIIINVDKIRTW